MIYNVKVSRNINFYATSSNPLNDMIHHSIINIIHNSNAVQKYTLKLYPLFYHQYPIYLTWYKLIFSFKYIYKYKVLFNIICEYVFVYVDNHAILN